MRNRTLIYKAKKLITQRNNQQNEIFNFIVNKDSDGNLISMSYTLPNDEAAIPKKME